MSDGPSRISTARHRLVKRGLRLACAAARAELCAPPPWVDQRDVRTEYDLLVGRCVTGLEEDLVADHSETRGAQKVAVAESGEEFAPHASIRVGSEQVGVTESAACAAIWGGGVGHEVAFYRARMTSVGSHTRRPGGSSVIHATVVAGVEPSFESRRRGLFVRADGGGGRLATTPIVCGLCPHGASHVAGRARWLPWRGGGDSTHCPQHPWPRMEVRRGW